MADALPTGPASATLAMSEGRTSPRLSVTIGQHSQKGQKPLNQDFHGAATPTSPALDLKGIAVAIADGVSSSDVSHIAAETAVKGFLSDYYCTTDAWPVKTAAETVIAATNAWLHAETQRKFHAHERESGYICTLCALVLKGRKAHLFHVGDSRIYRMQGRSLEQLTQDHTVRLSADEAYLGRALGIQPHVEIDYRTVPVARGDIFVMTTDGVHDFAGDACMAETVARNGGDLDLAARLICERALENGSGDNLTVQIVRIDGLAEGEADDFLSDAVRLPTPALPEPRDTLDGYRIIRALHASARSHVYLAEDLEDGSQAVLKLPSVDLRGDASYLRHFAMEEWIARRISSAHVLKLHKPERERSALYLASEYVEGETLAQWMRDHPKTSVSTMRGIAEQVARGLLAFHRREMVHQDLKPENVMLDHSGTAKIIDFGSTKVAGVIEVEPDATEPMLGTLQYTAPEVLAGEPSTARSDLFSLGVICYQMLTGDLPYGAAAARVSSTVDARRMRYRPIADTREDVPAWLDQAIAKAVHPDPARRYSELSEFIHDLGHPNPAFAAEHRQALAERDPLTFWKAICALLVLVVFTLLALWPRG